LLGIRIKALGTNNSDDGALEAKLVFLAYRGSPLPAEVHARRPDGN